jgi:hypothetical protein
MDDPPDPRTVRCLSCSLWLVSRDPLRIRRCPRCRDKGRDESSLRESSVNADHSGIDFSDHGRFSF